MNFFHPSLEAELLDGVIDERHRADVVVRENDSTDRRRQSVQTFGAIHRLGLDLDADVGVVIVDDDFVARVKLASGGKRDAAR